MWWFMASWGALCCCMNERYRWHGLIIIIIWIKLSKSRSFKPEEREHPAAHVFQVLQWAGACADLQSESYAVGRGVYADEGVPQLLLLLLHSGGVCRQELRSRLSSQVLPKWAQVYLQAAVLHRAQQASDGLSTVSRPSRWFILSPMRRASLEKMQLSCRGPFATGNQPTGKGSYRCQRILRRGHTWSCAWYGTSSSSY